MAQGCSVGRSNLNSLASMRQGFAEKIVKSLDPWRRPCAWSLLALIVGGLGMVQSRADQVVISEMMHAPEVGGVAWVEIQNLTATPFDIAEWRFEGKNLRHVFPSFSKENPQRSFLRPFERILLSSEDPGDLSQRLGLASTVRVYGPWEGALGKERDDLRLIDKNGVGLCRLRYGVRGDWPLESHGTGHSLVLQDADALIDDASNWASSLRLGGTPGSESVPASGIPVDLTTGPSYAATQIFGLNSKWRFRGEGRELDPSWRRLDFDDRDWSEGEALFGFEESPLPDPGLQTPLRRGHVAYYFRKEFQYSGGLEGARVVIDQVVDDGAIYYLNGKRLGRIRMRASLPAQSQYATETVTDARLEAGVLSLETEALRRGKNVLAVQVHQANRNSSDLVFGCRLNILQPIEGSLQLNRVSSDTGGQADIEVFNRSDRPIDLETLKILVSGLNKTESVLSGRGRIEPGSSAQIDLGMLEGVSKPIQSIAMMSADEGVLWDQVSVVGLQEGWTQFRDLDRAGKWFRKPLESDSIDPRMPRPATGQVHITEIEFGGSPGASWLELSNQGPEPIPENFLRVVFDRSDEPVVISRTLEPGDYVQIDFELSFDEGTERVFLKNALGETLAAHEFELFNGTSHFCRYPETSDEWYLGVARTKGTPNVAPKRPLIAINELMMEPAFGNDQGEFLELVNYGEKAVDLSGARFVRGIDFEFATGTILDPGAYLVLAEDVEWMQESYPYLSSVFEYRGALKNDGEWVRLEDRFGNLIDEVCYQVEGDWPALSAGRGSSLEAIHPALERKRSSAWAASRVQRVSDFRRYEFTGTYGEVAQMGRVSDYRELHFYLVGESHVVLRNIALQAKSGGRNLITSLPGSGTGEWLIQGNHADSFFEGGRLHLIAHGHGDNRANRAEIDVPGLREGQAYTLSFEARWVSGGPRLIAHTWDNSFAHSFRIDIPRELGTPGRQNSRYRSNPGPQVDDLRQSPAVPAPGDSVEITVDVHGDSSQNVAMYHRVVDRDGDETWTVSAMSPVDPSGDHGSGTRYRGQLLLESQHGTIVEYYVKAFNADGVSGYLPREGQDEPGLVIFDQRQIASDLRTVRMIVHPRDIERLLGWNTVSNEKYPRLSNQYFNATFVSDEAKVYHGAEIRRSGSPWTRRGGLTRGKWKLPKDREFRGHGKFSFDDDPEKWTRHHNRITRYLLYLMGHPVSENEFVRVIVNTDPVMLREDVEPVDADFLNRNFQNGNDGELYRIDDQWWFTDNWRQAHRDASWDFVGSKNPSWYRNAWMKRSREEEDDYSNLVEFFELVSSERYSRREINQWLDSDQILKMTAVMGFVGDWDSFTQRRGKNAYFYRRPNDGRFQFLQWDTDLAFQRSGRSFYGGRRAFVSWVRRPENLSRLKVALMQLDDFCNKNPERVRAWIQAEEEAHPETRINAQMYLDWFSRQERNVDRFLSQ